MTEAGKQPGQEMLPAADAGIVPVPPGAFRPKKKKPPRGVYDVCRMGLAETVRYSCMAAGITAVFAFLFYDSLMVFLAAVVPAVLFFLRLQKKRIVRERKAALKKQFLSAGTLLSDYLRSGYAVESAVRQSTGELIEMWGADSDIVREWKIIGAGLSYNHPVEELFGQFADRTGIPEIRDFADLFAVVNRSDGQVTEVLKAKTDLMKEAYAAEEQIETLLTAKQFEQRIMDVTPILILLYIRFTSPELLGVLYSGLAGRLIMTAAIGVYAAAFFWAEQIVRTSKEGC